GGARVTLEGPAVLRIADENAAALDLGKAVTRVDNSAFRFEIDTPFAKVREQSTEFAVAVAKEGATDVHVLQGKAEVLPLQIGRSDKAPQWAVAGERIEVPKSGALVRSKSENTVAQFARRLPPQGNELRITRKYVEAMQQAAPDIYWRFENASGGRVA